MQIVQYTVDGGIAVISLASPPLNLLSHPLRSALRDAIGRAGSDPGVIGIVIRGEGRAYSAGAEVSEFATGLRDRDPALPGLLDLIEALPKPVVAAIQGDALGGGLELAMACHARVAHPHAQLGQPEVRLGLVPGAGGTWRLPRLVGVPLALEMCSGGKPVSAAVAHEAGLIDELCEGNIVEAAAGLARRLGDRKQLRRSSALDCSVPVPAPFDDLRTRTQRRSRGQIAPGRCIDMVEAACRTARAEWEHLERAASLECRNSPQHAALWYQFRAEREARCVPGVTGVAPLPIRSAAVIGAGTMGGGIAMCFAGAGIPVALIEKAEDSLKHGIGIIRKNYGASVSRGSMTQDAADRAVALITPTADFTAVGGADIIVEAVFEDLALKTEIFGRLDELAPPHAILGTNTSSLDIDAIAAATSRPGKVIGTHFFSPANIMRLLENVRGSRTSPETIVTAMELGRRIGKVPVLAGNCDGFIGNRMLQFYTGGAEYLLEEGATPEQIDRVMEDFGMPMGPLAMRDLAGNDVGLMIRKARAKTLPREERLSPILERIVGLGRLGQKSGAGFYRYEGRNRVSDDAVMELVERVSKELGMVRRQISDEEILARLLHPLVNEGAKILDEGIALRAGDIDVVYVNGYGFPAWRGGPMYWAAGAGLESVRSTMVKLGERFGPRWWPAPLLEKAIREQRGWDEMKGRDHT